MPFALLLLAAAVVGSTRPASEGTFCGQFVLADKQTVNATIHVGSSDEPGIIEFTRGAYTVSTSFDFIRKSDSKVSIFLDDRLADAFRSAFIPGEDEVTSLSMYFWVGKQEYTMILTRNGRKDYIPLSRSFCQYPELDGKFCGITRLNNKKSSLCMDFNAADAEATLTVVHRPSEQAPMISRPISFVLDDSGLIQFNQHSGEFLGFKFVPGRSGADKITLEAASSISAHYSASRKDLFVEVTGKEVGVKTLFHLTRDLVMFPSFDGVYFDSLTMVDVTRSTSHIRITRYGEASILVKFEKINPQSGRIEIEKAQHDIDLFYDAASDSLSLHIDGEQRRLAFLDLPKA